MSDNSPLNDENTAGEKKSWFSSLFGGGKSNKPTRTSSQVEVEQQQPGFSGDVTVERIDEQQDKAEQSQEEKEAIAAKNKKTLTLLAAGGVAFLVLAGGTIFALMPDEKPVPVNENNMASLTATEGENTASGEANQESAPTNPDGTLAQGQPEMAVIGIDPLVALKARDSLETNHWARSNEPIKELAKKAVQESITGVPEYSADVQGFYITKDVVYTPLSPQYGQLIQATQSDLEAQLSERLTMAKHQDKSFLVRTSNTQDVALGAPPQTVIANPQEFAELELLSRQISMQILTEKISQARASIPQEAPQEQQQVVAAAPADTGISEAQRREYNRLQERSKAMIEDLTRKNKELLDEIAAKDKQMLEIMQKVEDSPKAQAKLKAHMLETKSNLKVQAIQGDLIFLADKNDKVYTVRIGDPLPERNNLIISNVNADTGIVYVTER